MFYSIPPLNLTTLMVAAHTSSTWGICLELNERTHALFLSPDYPVITPLRSVGADGVSNTVGRRFFGKETYTFWIMFNTERYILPQSESIVTGKLKLSVVSNHE